MLNSERKFKRKHKLYYFISDYRVITLIDKTRVRKDKKTGKYKIRKLLSGQFKEMLAQEFEKQAEKIRKAEDINNLGILVEKDEADLKARNAKMREEENSENADNIESSEKQDSQA